FPDIEWSKPEQKSHAGRLGIIGGNSLGFAAVAESYQTALKTGAGMARILLPDVLKKNIPTGTVEVIYGPSNPSGGLAREAITEMKALSEWATGILMIGDAGRNSETAILYEEFIKKYDGPLIVARDAVDLTTNDPSSLIERPNTVLVLSFAQLQRIFKNAYYPIVITFSMQITNLVEALHKFTVTYPITIVVFHNDTIIVAQGGNVTTTPWNNPMAIWRGITPTIMASYWLWNPSKPLESITASLLNN
ncbi:hypothetical protein HGB24_02865, partial [Candidatus Saccharibacteria bacterium]|nr:hypothetical protein [Candidatus Saccharibacteria bacterium]